jgi:hypothetical protein
MTTGDTYKVKRGDCLWTIAKEKYGDPLLWHTIANHNHLRNPNLIFIGQPLKLPHAATSHKPPTSPSFRASEARPIGTALPLANPAFTIPLDGQQFSYPCAGCELTLKLQGNITMRKRGCLKEDFEVSVSEISWKHEPDAENVFRKVISEAVVKLTSDNRLELSISGGALTCVAYPGGHFDEMDIAKTTG